MQYSDYYDYNAWWNYYRPPRKQRREKRRRRGRHGDGHRRYDTVPSEGASGSEGFMPYSMPDWYATHTARTYFPAGDPYYDVSPSLAYGRFWGENGGRDREACREPGRRRRRLDWEWKSATALVLVLVLVAMGLVATLTWLAIAHLKGTHTSYTCADY